MYSQLMKLNEKFEFFSFHKIKLLLQLFVYKKIVSLKNKYYSFNFFNI